MEPVAQDVNELNVEQSNKSAGIGGSRALGRFVSAASENSIIQ